MKIIITEDQFKYLTNKVKLLENEEINYKTKILAIGDQMSYFISKYFNLEINNLISLPETKQFDTKSLFVDLMDEKPLNDVNKLIISIGEGSVFSDDEYVKNLCDVIYHVFPNAEYYIIQGFLDEEKFKDLTEEEIYDINSLRESYYEKFPKNNFFIVNNQDLTYFETPFNDEEKKDLIYRELNNYLGYSVKDSDENYEDEFGYNDYEEKTNNIKTNKSDDENDFNSIYEFLDRFEKICDSGIEYSLEDYRNKYDPDVHQIELALRFLLPDLIENFENDGYFDYETKEAIQDYQYLNDLKPTGIADTETLLSILDELKIKGFDDNDLNKFLKNQDDVLIDNSEEERKRKEKERAIYLMKNGMLKLVGLSSEQESNVNIMINYMNENGITNPFNQVGILSVIGKESGYIPKGEVCYDTTSDSRILDIFGSCRLNDEKIKKDWSHKYGDDVTVTELKKHCEDFFDAVYGKTAKGCFSWDTGHDEVGDGYKYRGRGFNQITFKNTYKKIGDMIGEDLVGNPERLNDVEVAAKAAVAFFTSGKKGDQLPQFDNTADAINYFVDKNAGGSGSSEGRSKSFQRSKHFEIIDKTESDEDTDY
jgi:predicted chitinase/peptidoglycan hydrolase-like protein with peptidoglycan-binding domain